MRIKYISSDIIISGLYDQFNLQSDDWVGRTPNWIYEALRHYRNNKVYIIEAVESTFQDNIILLPQYAGEILLLIVNDQILVNNNTNIEYRNILNTLTTSNDKYSIADNVVELESNNGTYKLFYKTLPVEFNDKFQIYCPKVPDKQHVIDNIKWFVLKNILSRGYVHPVYSLGNRNPEYDPNLKWQNTLNKARVQLSEMDNTDRNNIANINMQFITRPSYNTNQVSHSFKLNKDEI